MNQEQIDTLQLFANFHRPSLPTHQEVIAYEHGIMDALMSIGIPTDELLHIMSIVCPTNEES